MIKIIKNIVMKGTDTIGPKPRLRKQPPMPEETKVFTCINTIAYPRSFAVFNGDNNLSWHSCRETFSGQFGKETGVIMFSHKEDKGKNVEAFVRKIEDKLRLLNVSRAKFYATQRNTITAVEPSEWWKSLHVRRQLFTIILRCGQNYVIEDDNFDDALKSEKYAAETIDAIDYFLHGNTFCGRKQINNMGWRDAFFGKKKKDIEKILVVPPRHAKKKLAEVNIE